MKKRIAFLHTGAVVIAGFAELASELLPDVEVQNLLDDRIVADLGSGVDPASIASRLESLGNTAVAAGASALLFTCSSISQYAGELQSKLGVPVLRIDEAMADGAVATGKRVGVVATLATTLRPTVGLLQERAASQGVVVEIAELVVPGAFEAVVAGDRARHDELVAEAIEQMGANNDVVVLAQASMASAAQIANVEVPVLSSPRPGIERLARLLA